MGVSAICVRQRRQFRVRNDLVQCDVDTVQYSLFNFGVNKFISGVNSYNLGVIVQPGCEASHTCEQRQSGVIHFPWYISYCFGMITQIPYERTLLV